MEDQNSSEKKSFDLKEINNESSVVTIRLLSAIPAELEALLQQIADEEIGE